MHVMKHTGIEDLLNEFKMPLFLFYCILIIATLIMMELVTSTASPFFYLLRLLQKFTKLY